VGVDPARHPQDQEPHSLGAHRGDMVALPVIDRSRAQARTVTPLIRARAMRVELRSAGSGPWNDISMTPTRCSRGHAVLERPSPARIVLARCDAGPRDDRGDVPGPGRVTARHSRR
jgi:hypothetical protein